jgi:hypothetical protein
MATNKRKDAAALFELLDRSTLKLPKNSNGSLKIPSWWSSRTNPAPERPRPPLPLPNTPPAAHPAADTAADPSDYRTDPPAVPPAGSTVDPYVDPDGRMAHVSRVAPPPPELAGSAEHAAEAPVAGSAASLPAPRPQERVRPPAGVVIPQTVDPARFAPSNRPLSTVPPWALAAGAAAIAVLIIAAIVIASSRRHKVEAAPQTMVALPAESADTARAVSIIVPDNTLARPASPAAQAEAPAAAAAPAPAAGRVLDSSQFHRSPDRWYLRMYSAKSETLAKQNAEFLAQHGLTVSVERSGSFYVVVDALGFAQRDGQSEDYRRQVVAISHEHPDFKRRHKGPYDECYFSKGWN